MLRKFLSKAEYQRLSHFPDQISENDLITYFLLTPTDQEQLSGLQGNDNRIGFALLLCALRYLGYFPHDLAGAPKEAITYLAQQLTCQTEALELYGQRQQTRRDHQRWIMAYLGFQRASTDDTDHLVQWLSQRALENNRPSVLLQQACEHLYKLRLVRPAITTLERIIMRARAEADALTYRILGQPLEQSECEQLDQLLEPDLDLNGRTPLTWLRRPATGYAAEDILDTLAKLHRVETWAIDTWPISALPPSRIQYLSQLARRSSNQALQRKPAQKRYPILVAFLADAREHLTDELLDLFDHRIAKTYRDAKRELKEHQLELTQSLQEKVWHFHRIARVVLDAEVADDQLRIQIYQLISQKRLEQMVAEAEAQEPLLDTLHFFDKRYTYFRRFFPSLLDTLQFHAYQPPHSLLGAIQVLRDMNAGDRLPETFDHAPLDFVSRQWRSRVIQADGRVNRRWYELCVLSELRDALRSGQIWVEHSRRYTNLETYLIPKVRWFELRDAFCELVNTPKDGKRRLQLREKQLERAFEQFNQQAETDPNLRVEKGRLVLTPLEGESGNSPLAIEIRRLMPRLQLAELLHEVDTWTNFSQHFIHAGENVPRAPDLNRHLYAVLLAQARNIEFRQMVDIAEVSYQQLLWCNNWYIREETLQAATNVLVNYQYQQPLSHAWGDGTFSSSDGQRFEVSVRTQNATPLPRYFGYGRGLTFLTWTSNQLSQYGTLVTAPTTREATFVLDKILDNDTDLRIREHTTDTGGYTDLIFALFDLLGLQFSPRLRDLGDHNLYTLDTSKSYPNIQVLINQKQRDREFILNQWDEMLRLAASLKLRWVTASLLIGKLQAFPRQHTLLAALQEYGRLVKTLFILRYTTIEAYRRRIATQLNKGEDVNSLRAYLCSANRGRIKHRFPEQHIQMANCLNLLSNAIVLWNTVYMQAALDHLRQNGWDISEEEIIHLSPTRVEHINIHGKYQFDISVPLTNNGLRPLVDSGG